MDGVNSRLERDLSDLQKLAMSISTPYGSYVSKRSAITVGISQYPFKVSTCAFLTFSPFDPDTMKIIRKKLEEKELPLSHMSLSHVNLVTDIIDTSYILAKYEIQGIDVFREEFFKLAEVKKELAGLLFTFDSFLNFKEADVDEVEVPDWVNKVYETAMKHGVKIVVNLDKSYNYSLVVDKDNFFIRRKLLSGNFSSIEDFEIGYPVGGGIYAQGNKLYAVRPFIPGENFEDAVKALYLASAQPVSRRKQADKAYDITF